MIYTTCKKVTVVPWFYYLIHNAVTEHRPPVPCILLHNRLGDVSYVPPLVSSRTIRRTRAGLDVCGSATELNRSSSSRSLTKTKVSNSRLKPLYYTKRFVSLVGGVA